MIEVSETGSSEQSILQGRKNVCSTDETVDHLTITERLDRGQSVWTKHVCDAEACKGRIESFN